MYFGAGIKYLVHNVSVLNRFFLVKILFSAPKPTMAYMDILNYGYLNISPKMVMSLIV